MDKLSIILFLVVATFSYGQEDGFSIDVLCDDRRIGVRIAFDSPFRGLVFSKGFHKDPECRYITAESVLVETFDIDVGKCGTKARDVKESVYISNEIVIQHDPLLQTSLDSEVTFTCELHNGTTKRLTSTVNRVQDESIKPLRSFYAWMDLKLESSADQNSFYVGDKVVVLIYVRREKHNTGVLIKNCNARNTEESSSIVELLDESGCSKDPRLLTSFSMSAAPPGMNANVVAVAKMNAFRFTDSDELTLTCQVELCHDECPTSCAAGEPHSRKPLVKRSVDSSNIGNRHFMYRAMSALAARLKSRQEKLNEQNLVANSDDILGRSAILENVSFAPEMSKSVLITSSPTEIDTFLVVARKFSVLSYMTKEFGGNATMSQSPNICVPRARFIMLTTLLVFVLVALLIASIGMVIYVKKEKKRNLISSYLLYSYK